MVAYFTIMLNNATVIYNAIFPIKVFSIYNYSGMNRTTIFYYRVFETTDEGW